MNKDDLVQRWLGIEALRHTLIDMAARLAPMGIELLVVKGIYFAFALGADPARRSMLDADAIVVKGSFDAAVDRLRSAGDLQPVGDDWSTKGFQRTGAYGFIDLHRLPLPLCFGRVERAKLRARARRMPEELGPHLLVPDPYDAASVSIANYVKDCLAVSAGAKLADDLSLVSAKADVAPAPLAERLREHGLRRIGIAAFGGLASMDPRWNPWLDALRPSRVERRAATLLRQLMARQADRHPDLSFLTVRTIADSPWRAAGGFSFTAARFLRDRARPWLGPRRRNWLRGAL